MKRKGRIWALVVIILVVVLACTTALGLTTQYGDITTTVVKPLSDMAYGPDVNGMVNVVITPDKGVEATEDQMTSLETVIRSRLSVAGVSGATITVDEKGKQVFVSFPYPANRWTDSPESIVQTLLTENLLTVREGAEEDENGRPTGVSENVIFNGYEVLSAEAKYDMLDFFSGEMEHFIALTLSSAAEANYYEVMNRLAWVEENGTFSVWLDDQMITSAAASRLAFYSEGAALVGDSFTATSVSELVAIINSRPLPFKLAVKSMTVDAPTAQPEVSVLAVVLAAFVAISVVLIVVYRLPGVVAAVTLAGQMALTLAILSGYFNVFTSRQLTRPGIVAVFLVLGIGAASNVLVNAKLREDLRAGKKLSLAIPGAFSWENIAPVVETNILLVIVSLFIMGIFSETGSFFAALMTPFLFAFPPVATSVFYSFGFVLFWGTLFNLFFSLFINWLLLRAFSRFDRLSSERLYGALKEGAEPREVKPSKIINHRKKYALIPVLLLVAAIALGAVLGVNVDQPLRPGFTAEYSYVGEIDAEAMANASWLRAAVSAYTGQKGPEITVTQIPADILFAEQRIRIEVADSASVTPAVAERLLNVLQKRYPTQFVREVSMSTRTLNDVLWNIARLGVIALAALVLIWIYSSLRLRRFAVKKGFLPLFFQQLTVIVPVLIFYFVFNLPIGASLLPVFLVAWSHAVYGLLLVYKRMQYNRALYGKKLSLKDTGNLTLAQCRSRLLLSTACAVLPLIALSAYAWVFALQGVLTLALALLVAIVFNFVLTMLVFAPWWIARLGRRPAAKKRRKTSAGKKTAAKAQKGKKSKAAKGTEPDEDEDESVDADDDDDLADDDIDDDDEPEAEEISPKAQKSR